MIVIAEKVENIKNYKLEYSLNGIWKSIFNGTNTNKIKVHRFDGAWADKVRITVEQSTKKAQITEFGIYNERK